jgi:hypothetical protein
MRTSISQKSGPCDRDWPLPSRQPHDDPRPHRHRFARSTLAKDTPLVERVRSRCDRKVRKLAPWSAGPNPKKTVLLLENDDIALMSEDECGPGSRRTGQQACVK